MKVKLFYFLLFTLISTINLRSQVYDGSWYLGLGPIYPRYISITNNSISDDNNFGFYTSLGYKVSKHSDLRLTSKYLSLSSFYYKNNDKNNNSVNLFSLDLDVLYSPYPCDYLSPYLLIGFGYEVFNSSNPYSIKLDNTKHGYQLVFGLGAEFRLNNKFNLVSEFAYITSSSNKVDGNFSSNENKGVFDSNGDTYFTASLGIKYIFNKIEKNNFCKENITGLRDIDNLIVINEMKLDTVFVTVDSLDIEEMKIWGTNFEFNKSKLRLESYPILDNVVDFLNKHPEINLEVHGHTDNYGDDDYNIKLSYRRAESVRNYLVYKGISSARLTLLGLGESFPIANNLTAEGRARNRRIEFKVIK